MSVSLMSLSSSPLVDSSSESPDSDPSHGGQFSLGGAPERNKLLWQHQEIATWVHFVELIQHGVHKMVPRYTAGRLATHWTLPIEVGISPRLYARLTKFMRTRHYSGEIDIRNVKKKDLLIGRRPQGIVADGTSEPLAEVLVHRGGGRLFLDYWCGQHTFLNLHFELIQINKIDGKTREGSWQINGSTLCHFCLRIWEDDSREDAKAAEFHYLHVPQTFFLLF